MIGKKLVGALLAAALAAATAAALLFVEAERHTGPAYDEGKQLFLSRCATCHAREAQAQTSLGPSMFGLAERAGGRVQSLDAAEYVVQSLFEPMAFVVPGFPAVMPGQLLNDLDDEKVHSLVGYVLNLGGETDPELIEHVKLPVRTKAGRATFDRAEIERGAHVFWQEGRCGTCHAAHADEQDGNVAPRIFHVGLTVGQIRAKLQVRQAPVSEPIFAPTLSAKAAGDAPGVGAPTAPPVVAAPPVPNDSDGGELVRPGPHTIQLVSGASPVPDRLVVAPVTLNQTDLDALVKALLLLN